MKGDASLIGILIRVRVDAMVELLYFAAKGVNFGYYLVFEMSLHSTRVMRASTE